MNRSNKRNLRFKVALAWAFTCAVVVFLCGFAIVTLVKVKRINDLATHSFRLSTQIAGLESLKHYLLERSDAPDKKEAEKLLRVLLEGDPFIEELVLIDQFGKVPFSIVMTDDSLSVNSDSAFLSMPLNNYVLSREPSLNEKNWEYRIPLTLESDVPWGTIKIRWRSDATWKFFRLLKLGVAYTSLSALLIAFMLGFFLLARTYDREYTRFVKNLTIVCGGDYSQRIDAQSFSKGMSEIAVHVNRILHDTEEEKKKCEVLDQSLRQIERGCSDYRRNLYERSSELDSVRREMRESLVQLFDMLWCGIVILDDNYRIHYINDQADRLLRFARLEDSFINDERIHNCLAPLVRQKSVDAVDDLCVWPQPSLGQSVSCHIRASRIPTGGSERLYFMLLREEGGYPKNHNSAYFSERLVLDYLVRDADDEYGEFNPIGASWHEERFRACLRRLDTFHALEKGNVGPITSIRLTTWLRNHFSDDDLFSDCINLDANVPDLDISLRIPEKILREMLDTMMVLCLRFMDGNRSKSSKYTVLRASLDSNGKPMITLSLPDISKKDATTIHDVLNERMPANQDGDSYDDTIEGLEIDICYSLFRCVKQLMKAHIVCVYSEIKKLAMVRLTIENHTFQSTKEEQKAAQKILSAPPQELVHQFLTRMT